MLGNANQNFGGRWCGTFKEDVLGVDEKCSENKFDQDVHRAPSAQKRSIYRSVEGGVLYVAV